MIVIFVLNKKNKKDTQKMKKREDVTSGSLFSYHKQVRLLNWMFLLQLNEILPGRGNVIIFSLKQKNFFLT